MTSSAPSATRPSPVFRECDGAPWPSDDELEMDAAWAALRRGAAVEWYDGIEADAVVPSRDPGPLASEAWIDDEWFDERRPGPEQTLSDLDARLGHLEIVAAERQRATAEEYRLIAAILARAAADPTPWVGPDPTTDPAWADPRGRRTAAVRRDRVDIAERAAVAEIAVRLHLSEQTVRLRAARAEMLQDRCPKMWRAFADGRVSERHAIETARLAGSLPGVGEIIDPRAVAGSADARTPSSETSPADATPADAGATPGDPGATPTDPGATPADPAHTGDRRDDPATVVWRAFDSAVRERAITLVPAKFAVAARAIRERVHAESLERRHRRAAEDRGVWMTAELDGMASLNALLPADRARGMMARIDRIARHLRAAPPEDRTLAQLRADALSDLVVPPAPEPDRFRRSRRCPRRSRRHEPRGRGRPPPPADVRSDAAAATRHVPAARHIPAIRDVPAARTATTDRSSPRTSRPTVIVTIPVLTLLGRSAEPPTLDGYGPIDLDTARRLAGEATSWVRLLTHPVDGTPLALDRKTYRVPVALRRWLGVTSPTCVFPGCGRAAADCDVDHRDAWAEGGTTDEDNLDPKCRHHHRLKHESRWMPSSTPDAELTWTSPLGGSYGADPPPF